MRVGGERFKAGWVLSFILLLGSPVLQAASEPDASLVAAPSKSSSFKTWTGGIEWSSSTTLHEVGDARRQADTGISASLHRNFSTASQASLSGAVSRTFTGEEKLSLDDMTLRYAQRFGARSDRLSYSAAMGALIPLSEDSQQQSTLTVLTLTPTLRLNWGEVEASLGLTLQRGFHRYETALTGMSNSAWALNPSLGLSWNWKKLSLSLAGQWNNAWTYAGNIKQSFLLAEEVGLELWPALAVAGGHRNGGNVLKPNGESSNIALFDEQSSVFYLTVAFNF